MRSHEIGLASLACGRMRVAEAGSALSLSGVLLAKPLRASAPRLLPAEPYAPDAPEQKALRSHHFFRDGKLIAPAGRCVQTLQRKSLGLCTSSIAGGDGQQPAR